MWIPRDVDPHYALLNTRILERKTSDGLPALYMEAKLGLEAHGSVTSSGFQRPSVHER